MSFFQDPLDVKTDLTLMDEVDLWADAYVEEMMQFFIERLLGVYLNILELCFCVVKKNIPVFLLFFKHDWYHQFRFCMDLVGYDRPGKVYRFTVIYYLLSVVYNTRFHLITQTDELTGLLSNYMIFKSINWSERELWDMFGILILQHPDLRRILTDYGFASFPLRKDFPLTGYVELIYSDYIKNLEYRDVELMQEMRKTLYHSPWKSLVSPAV